MLVLKPITGSYSSDFQVSYINAMGASAIIYWRESACGCILMKLGALSSTYGICRSSIGGYHVTRPPS